MGFPTPNSVPPTTTCRTIQIPDDPLWFAIVNGALSELLDLRNYEQYGTLTPEETANAFATMFYDYLASDCSALPAPTVLDDFNRADNSTLGTNWTADPNLFGNTMFTIVGNQAVTDGVSQAYWNVETFGTNSKVFAQITAIEDGQSAAFNLCLVNPGTVNASGYAIVLALTSGVYSVTIHREDNLSFTAIKTISSIDFAPGNWFAAYKSGTNVVVQTSTDGILWINVGVVADSAYDTGYIGIYGSNGSGSPVKLDNFGGGALP